MIEIFKSTGDQFNTLDIFEEGAWIKLTSPTEQDISSISTSLGVDVDYLKAALDEEERSRIEMDNGQTLIVVDIPIVEIDSKSYIYTTVPLGIIVTSQNIITVCLKDTIILKDFAENRVKSFFTFKKTRFILQILYRNAAKYLMYLRQIDKESSRIEKELHKSMKNKELIQLLSLEKSLVYFSTSLKGNEIVMEKMLRLDYVKKYPEDTELLQDVIIENKQAIEMTKIYSDILSGTMDAFASVISNNVNIIMKFLTSVTIVMSIPTMIASFYGMNVHLPLQEHPYAFLFIMGFSVFLCVISIVFMMSKKMF